MPQWRRVPQSACGAPLVAVFAVGDVADALDALPKWLREVLTDQLAKAPPLLDGHSPGEATRSQVPVSAEASAQLVYRSAVSVRGEERTIVAHRFSADTSAAAANRERTHGLRAAARSWLRETLRAARSQRVQSVALVVLGAVEEFSSAGQSGLLESEGDLANTATEGWYRFSALRLPNERQGKSAEGSSEEPGLVVRVCGPLVEGKWSPERVSALMAALCFARTLGNAPPNIATPEWIASIGAQAAGQRGMQCEVWEEEEIRRRGLGGLTAVGQGSSHPPRLLHLQSGGRGERRKRVALVGKGVTFDSGGLSIKPAASMEEMKYDKCGACTVLALALLLRDLESELDLEVFVPLAENLPDADAYRPSDILTMADGTTVEIVNTDAEGRLLLADALALASRTDPHLLLEFSTLTGAAVVALGERAAALYTPSSELAACFAEASERTGERFWRMPLWEEDLRRMKGTHAQLQNASDRWGSANTAAAFLSHFVRAEHWAHLDIAGPAYRAKAGQHGEAGATGFGLVTAVQVIESSLL